MKHGKYNCIGASVCTKDGCMHCCWCGVEMNPAWTAFARALFYVCKAMGPPRFVAWVGDGWINRRLPIAARDPEQSSAWWSWYDGAASVCA